MPEMQDAKVGLGTVAPARPAGNSGGGFKSHSTVKEGVDSSRESYNGDQDVNVVIKPDGQKSCCSCQ